MQNDLTRLAERVEAMPICEECGEWPATDVDGLCGFCGDLAGMQDEAIERAHAQGETK